MLTKEQTYQPNRIKNPENGLNKDSQLITLERAKMVLKQAYIHTHKPTDRPNTFKYCKRSTDLEGKRKAMKFLENNQMISGSENLNSLTTVQKI